ncbi:MAG: outer membrane lipoprotein carrier protein LolA [Bacteroidetes bacterium]|nr:outer membrane lipoprotein carrier protein LolA [Bacteroidota bacterium]
MKNKLTTIVAALLLSTTCLFAQDVTHDPKAKSILDELSARLKTYTSVSAEFTHTMVDKADPDMNDSYQGKLLTKGKSYKIEVLGQHIISNGKIVWNHIPDEDGPGEVSIEDVPDDEDADDNIFSPTNIFKFYEKGFKYKYDKELVVKGVTCDQIKLFPEEIEDKGYHTVKLIVNRAKKQILSVVILMKDGMVYTYDITKFVVNLSLQDSIFNFDTKKYPGIEVNDLRM